MVPHQIQVELVKRMSCEESAVFFANLAYIPLLGGYVQDFIKYLHNIFKFGLSATHFLNKTLTGNGGGNFEGGRGGYNSGGRSGGGGGYNDRGSYDRGGNRDRYDQGSRGGGGMY